MKIKYVLLAALAALSLAALSACHDAIFATIETEKQVATNTLSQTLSVWGITQTAPDTYYVAAGGVFQGALSPAAQGVINWTPNSNNSARPFNPPGLSCNAMALLGTRLYGGFTDTHGNTSYYQSDAGLSFAAQSPTPTRNGQQVLWLRPANLNLFMSGADASVTVFELDYSTDGINWSATNLAGLGAPVMGVGYDSFNGTGSYWAAAGSTLYRSATAAFPVFTPVTDPGVGTDKITGLFVDSTGSYGRVFVLTKKSGIFYTTNGGASWTSIVADQPNGSVNPASYLAVGGPIDNAKTQYLVGTDGFGYYTLTVGGGSPSRFGDTTITLYSSSVSQILVDTTSGGQENVLLGTNGNGLWRAVFDPNTGTPLSGTNQYWIHE